MCCTDNANYFTLVENYLVFTIYWVFQYTMEIGVLTNKTQLDVRQIIYFRAHQA